MHPPHVSARGFWNTRIRGCATDRDPPPTAAVNRGPRRGAGPAAVAIPPARVVRLPGLHPLARCAAAAAAPPSYGYPTRQAAAGLWDRNSVRCARVNALVVATHATDNGRLATELSCDIGCAFLGLTSQRVWPHVLVTLSVADPRGGQMARGIADNASSIHGVGERGSGRSPNAVASAIAPSCATASTSPNQPPHSQRPWCVGVSSVPTPPPHPPQ